MEHLIKIDEEARIKVEDNNYTLQYKRKNGKDENRWDVGGYFSTVESLLKDYVTNAPARSNQAIHDLKGLIFCIQEAERHIERLLIKKDEDENETAVS